MRANLAVSYWSTGRTEDAIALLERVLYSRQRAAVGRGTPKYADGAREPPAASYESAGRTGRDALAAGELRVARLAADGLTNREIAQALFIATKTATALLGRVYRKLEISRRGQLAASLADQLGDSHEHPGATGASS